MIDWAAIETEYVTTDTSYRRLAKKYGVNATTIAKKAGSEGWVEKHKQYASKVQSETLDKISRQEVDRTARVLAVSDKLLRKIEAFADREELLNDKSIRALTAALRDLKEIQGVKSSLDMREQEARIAKLQREAAVENHEDNRVEVVFIGAEEDWME